MKFIGAAFGAVLILLLGGVALSYRQPPTVSRYVFSTPESTVAVNKIAPPASPSDMALGQSADVAVSVVGDLMFDRNVRARMKKYGNEYPF